MKTGRSIIASVFSLVVMVIMVGMVGTPASPARAEQRVTPPFDLITEGETPTVEIVISDAGSAGDAPGVTPQPGDRTVAATPAPGVVGKGTNLRALQRELPASVSSSAGDIVNGSFEKGADGSWLEYSAHGWPIILSDQYLLVPPRGGQWAAWVGGDNDEISFILQTVQIPVQGPVLNAWIWIASEETQCGNDFGLVVVDSDYGLFDLCAARNTNGWALLTADLSAYAGQTVQLQIRAETNSSLNSNLFVDDVQFEGSLQQRVQLYMPVVKRQKSAAPEPYAAPCGPSNDDCEPFNAWGAAYGPLQPGASYNAYPNDNNDYYHFALDRTSTVSVQVTNYQAVGQLLVRDQALKELKKDVNVPPNPDGNMSVSLPNLPAGKYFIQIFTSGEFNENQQYTLRMTR